MKILIQGGRLLDPASGLDRVGDLAIANGTIASIGTAPDGFVPDQTIDARQQWVLPGLVDLAVRLREPGYEHAGMLESEMHAAVAGGVTSLVCPPDTQPALDEAGLVEMLRYRADRLHKARLYPLGALTRGLAGEVLTEMAKLTAAGCVGFSQAEVPLVSNQSLQRALQYASTFGYSVWLRAQDYSLGQGVAASGAFAQRLGLSGISVAAETIALHTIFELLRASPCHVHLCRISSAAGLELVRQAKQEGLPVTCDISINSLLLTDMDIGYFDSNARLNPPLRQQRDRDALARGLADGTVDALVSDHTPVEDDAKQVPFAEAEPGATGLELLLALAQHWAATHDVPLLRALAVVTHEPARIIGVGLGNLQHDAGRLHEGGVADVCIFNPQADWVVQPDALCSQARHTPFLGLELPGRVQTTLVGGQIVFARAGTLAVP